MRTLYNAPQSTCSQRVRFALHAKGLAFEDVTLDLFSGDQLKPDYLAINPNGVVPSLVDHGKAVTDSAVILEYLEDAYDEQPRLRPSDPHACASMRAMMRFIDEVPTPAVRVPSYNLAFLPHFQAMSEAEFQALADSKPLRREFLLKMGRKGFSQDDMDEAKGRLQRGVARLAGWIEGSNGPWAMGETLTLVDVAIMPVIVRLADIRLSTLWDAYPRVARWLEAIRQHPAFDPTYYPGSLLTQKYPHLRDTLDKPHQPINQAVA